MRGMIWTLLLLLAAAGCAPEETVYKPLIKTDKRVITDSEREILRAKGFQVDPREGPDHLIQGVVTKISPDYKYATIKLFKKTDKIRKDDIFSVYMRMDDYDKQNRRMETEHKDYQTARIRVTGVQGNQVTGWIDHGAMDHQLHVGDIAVARTF